MSARNLINPTASAIAVLLGLLFTPTVPWLGLSSAHAEPKLYVKRFFGSPQDAPTVRVRAEDGKWLLLASPGITYKFSYRVEANRMLRFIYVAAGTRVAAAGQAPWTRGDISRGPDGRKYTAWGNASFFLPNSEIGGDRATVIGACNKLLSNGGTTARQQRTFVTLPINAAVAIGQYGDPDEFGRITGSVMVWVICEAEPPKIEAPPQPVGIDLRVEKLGERKCPRGVEVRAFIDYEKDGALARFRFRHNGELSGMIEIKPRKVTLGPKTFYRVERLKTYNLGPGHHSFKIEVENGGKSREQSIEIACPPFEVTWMNLEYRFPDTYFCPRQVTEELSFTANGPGEIRYTIKSQLGIVAHTGIVTARRKGNAYVATARRKLALGSVEMDMIAEWAKDPGVNSGWKKLEVECPKVLSGGFQFVDTAKPKCGRKARIVLNMSVDSTGKVPYSLLCAGGRAWHRVATAIPGHNGTFVAPDAVDLDVTRTETLQCSLVSMATGTPVVVATGAHDFACVKPAVDTPDDMAGTRRPPAAGGDSGVANPRLTVYAPNDLPDAPPQPPVGDRPSFSSPEPGCQDGAIRNGKCTCAAGLERQKLASNSFRCVRPVPEIACKDGSVQNGACVCPKGWQRTKLNATTFQCLQPKQKIACQGGSTKGGACACPRGLKVKKINANSFKCVKPKQTASCVGGKINKKGKCKCPQQTTLVHGRCIRPAG